MEHERRPLVLIANPGFDRYGSDLMMVRSARALRAAGWNVLVTSPKAGPLAESLAELGVETRLASYPIVRRADTTPAGAVRLAGAGIAAVPRLLRIIREVAPDVVYVNTVTLPWWLLAARLARVPAACHVREAEPNVRMVVRKIMASQLWLAAVSLMNSNVTRESLCEVYPALGPRLRLVYNGIEQPDEPVSPPQLHPGVVRAVVIGRLSPRKAPHIALEAVALLRASGLDARLEVCGTPVPGQEFYEEDLRRRAAQPDLNGAVTFSGYAAPVWPALSRADVFLATSTAEPFGNAVVEAQLACRPVVATAVEGHLETVLPERTGLLVSVGDAAGMAAAVRRLVDEPGLAERLAVAAQERAQKEFSPERYRREIVEVHEQLAARRNSQ
ncbi:glycosyltransferase family 4 protein [Mycolicibacterium sphagni]|uniref:glycosyltransferase family 4 protein n=1 Tax=Mycolicibacterium sphagni TaxID=1786 RepID=UPI0013FDCFE3|nr:glycosyltransferase family 4 protein [Mycolicibacterium sphagni]